MPVTLTVNNVPYQFPSPGDSPGWGQATTGWATAVTTVLNSILGSSDIPITSAVIANNQLSALNVVGLSFNTGTVRSAQIRYSVYRTSTGTPSGCVESGILLAVYDNSASVGNKWKIGTSSIVGNAGIIFSMTDTGQVQYVSTDIGATSYSGVIKFAAQTLPQ